MPYELVNGQMVWVEAPSTTRVASQPRPFTVKRVAHPGNLLITVRGKTYEVPASGTSTTVSADTRSSHLRKEDAKRSAQLKQVIELLKAEEEGAKVLEGMTKMVMPSTYIGPALDNSNRPYMERVLGGLGTGDAVSNAVIDLTFPFAYSGIKSGLGYLGNTVRSNLVGAYMNNMATRTPRFTPEILETTFIPRVNRPTFTGNTYLGMLDKSKLKTIRPSISKNAQNEVLSSKDIDLIVEDLKEKGIQIAYDSESENIAKETLKDGFDWPINYTRDSRPGVLALWLHDRYGISPKAPILLKATPLDEFNSSGLYYPHLEKAEIYMGHGNIDDTIIHESISHATDDIVKDMVVPVTDVWGATSNTNVSEHYLRITDILNDLPEQVPRGLNMSQSQYDRVRRSGNFWGEARATLNESVKPDIIKWAKKEGISYDEALPYWTEKFNKYIMPQIANANAYGALYKTAYDRLPGLNRAIWMTDVINALKLPIYAGGMYTGTQLLNNK